MAQQAACQEGMRNGSAFEAVTVWGTVSPESCDRHLGVAGLSNRRAQALHATHPHQSVYGGTLPLVAGGNYGVH
jgi:hypothetical protein